MKRGGALASVSDRVGVLDAGAVLARLDRRRRGHATVVDLMDRCRRDVVSLHVSVVNLAEALQHAADYSAATGLDIVTLLAGYHVQLHRPDVQIARRAARLATLHDSSLADRFALATAEALAARLFTTDAVVAACRGRVRIPITRL